MTNNNQIPMEVKKPVETVYELKGEYKIPSFEEFMKNYENDGNLNFDDLIGGNIGDAQGYGPCSWSNKDCTCYISQGLIPLHLACPATGCTNKEAYQWIHNSCSGRIYISTEAYLKCMSCSTTGHIKNWSFACSTHPGNFLPTTVDDCIDALGTVLKLFPNKSPEIKKIIRKISNKLMDDAGGF